MEHATALDLYVFERLPLVPYWMEHEQKFFVMYPTETEYETERFDTKEEARAFINSLMGEPK